MGHETTAVVDDDLRDGPWLRWIRHHDEVNDGGGAGEDLTGQPVEVDATGAVEVLEPELTLRVGDGQQVGIQCRIVETRRVGVDGGLAAGEVVAVRGPHHDRCRRRHQVTGVSPRLGTVVVGVGDDPPREVGDGGDLALGCVRDRHGSAESIGDQHEIPDRIVREGQRVAVPVGDGRDSSRRRVCWARDRGVKQPRALVAEGQREDVGAVEAAGVEETIGGVGDSVRLQSEKVDTAVAIVQEEPVHRRFDKNVVGVVPAIADLAVGRDA